MLTAIAAVALAASPVGYSDLATPFARTAAATADQPEAERVAAVRRTLDALLPGVYARTAGTDRRIATALDQFPAKRAAYDRVVAGFSAALTQAVARFRVLFPAFTSPLPIYLYHSLGQRDGGSSYLQPGHRLVMLFGADMIAELHSDASLGPFLDHELFHLEHAHAFPDCDQFWCTLWQEGLAVDAAAEMTPGATDHQLLLDTPLSLRRDTDAHWADALCFIAGHFDDTHGGVVGQALLMGADPPSGLPERFGYYVGYRIAQATGRPVPVLARLDHQASRPLVRATLVRLMHEAKATCPPPAATGTTTHGAANPV